MARVPPLADRLKHAFPDRWGRFHSLPESRRYPEDDADCRIALHRYNSILDDLFRGRRFGSSQPAGRQNVSRQHITRTGTRRALLAARTHQRRRGEPGLHHLHPTCSSTIWNGSPA